jgi:hypothetical protein
VTSFFRSCFLTSSLLTFPSSMAGKIHWIQKESWRGRRGMPRQWGEDRGGGGGRGAGGRSGSLGVGRYSLGPAPLPVPAFLSLASRADSGPFPSLSPAALDSVAGSAAALSPASSCPVGPKAVRLSGWTRKSSGSIGGSGGRVEGVACWLASRPSPSVFSLLCPTVLSFPVLPRWWGRGRGEWYGGGSVLARV